MDEVKKKRKNQKLVGVQNAIELDMLARIVTDVKITHRCTINWMKTHGDVEPKRFTVKCERPNELK